MNSNYYFLIFAIFVIFILFTYYKTKYSLGLFIILLPVLGQHPGYPNNKYYLASFAGIIVGMLLKRKENKIEPIFFIITLFFLIVCLLSLLPYLYQILETLYFYYDPKDWFNAIIDAPAENIFISLRNIIFYSAWIVFSFLLIRNSIPEQMKDSLAIYFCISATFYSLIGLLDFFNLIDLNKIRPTTFPTEHRLQSVFWHPAWFAEYVSMILPFFLSLFKARLTGRWIILYLVVIFLNVLAIILTFQRGGLVALIALFLIWAFIEFKKKRKFFIILSLSFVFLIIIALLIAYVADAKQFHFKFVKKFLENNRTKYLSAAIDMFAHSPLLGLGLDSYGWRYIEFRPENHPEYVYLHGSAHNQYFQFIAGTGFVGIFIYLILYFYALYSSYEKFNSAPSNFNFSLFLSFCIFGIYSLYQEMFYSLCIGSLFWIVISFIEFKPKLSNKKFINIIFILLIAFLVIYQFWISLLEKENFKSQVYSEGFGLYENEIWNSNQESRWTGRIAILPIGKGQDSLFILAMHPDINEKPVIAKFYSKEILLKELKWVKAEWKFLDLSEIRKRYGDINYLRIEVNRTWIPKEYGRLDNRSLGVAIRTE